MISNSNKRNRLFKALSVRLSVLRYLFHSKNNEKKGVSKKQSIFRPSSSEKGPVKRLKSRLTEGLTIVDLAFAILIASVMTVTITASVASALNLQREADRLSVAVSLAEIHLAQLLSNPYLSTTHRKGRYGSDAGIYKGYEWEVTVKEEKIDLAKVAEEGELKGVNLDDQLPASAQNTGGREKAGQSVTTQTGGLVDIVRIIVIIRYPRGSGGKGKYRVETIRGARKKS